MFPILQTEKQTDFSSDSLYRKIFELRTESSLQFAIEWQGKNIGITTPEEIIELNVVVIARRLARLVRAESRLLILMKNGQGKLFRKTPLKEWTIWLNIL